jgi:prolyl-tRNA editing enzyme YbaK/EbsC (Cys-tRNA(Pro) deacylase)
MIPEKVNAVLERHGLSALEYEPGSTPTAEMAAARVGVAVGQIAKSILLKGKDGAFRMVILPGDRKLSSAAIKRVTGVKHSMANAEQTEEVTGFRPGGVCPFGVNVEIIIDESLQSYEKIFPAAGTSSSAVPMTFAQLVEITGASVSKLTE